MESLKRTFEAWTVWLLNKTKLHIAYGDVYLGWKLGSDGSSHPTNPVRAQIATKLLTDEFPDTVILKPNATHLDRTRLGFVHDEDYVSRVLDDGHSGEWHPDSIEKGQVALEMFAGTVRCVDAILAGEAKVAFNPQGAKHHAQFDHSSGFCVFNDMAWAARILVASGMKVMYIDWDAHHGDGVENLLRDYPDAVTASIHDGTIFPGTGRNGHEPENGVYNWALPAGAGDKEFLAAMDDIETLANTIQPDIVLLATGADAHISDPLSTLNFDYPGYTAAAQAVARIANKHSRGRVLIGGAGGYQPFDHTPKIWGTVVSEVHRNVI